MLYYTTPKRKNREEFHPLGIALSDFFNGKSYLFAVDVPLFFIARKSIEAIGITKNVCADLCGILFKESLKKLVSDKSNLDMVGNVKARFLSHGLKLADYLY